MDKRAQYDVSSENLSLFGGDLGIHFYIIHARSVILSSFIRKNISDDYIYIFAVSNKKN